MQADRSLGETGASSDYGAWSVHVRSRKGVAATVTGMALSVLNSAWHRLFGLSCRPWQLRYGVSAAAVGLTIAVKLLGPSMAGEHTALLFFLPAVLISAIAGGVVLGLAATLVSAAACDFLLVVPYSFLLQDPEYNLQLGGFLVEGALVSVLGAGLARTRRRAEESLRVVRRSEERYRSAFDHVTVGAAHASADGRFLKTNEKFCEITGYSGDDLLGLSIWDLVYPDDLRAADFERVRAVLADGSETFFAEKRCVKKDGSVVRLELSATSAGGPETDQRYLVLVAHDVTERKKAEEDTLRLQTTLEQRLQRRSAQLLTSLQEAEDSEEMLRISFKRFTSLVRNASDIITILHPDGTIAYNSPAIERVLGYEGKALIGSKMVDGVHPEDAGRIRDALEESKDGAGDHPVGFRFRHENGSWRNLEAMINDLTDEPGVKGIVMNSRDVTERVRAEEALRKSEQRFRSLVQNSSDIVFTLGADGTLLYEGPAVEQILGHEPEARIGKKFLDLIHPEDAERVAEAFAEYLRNPDTRLPVEYRVRDRAGRWRHFEAVGNNLLDDPAVGSIVVNSREVTERKRVEAALRRSERLYRTVVEQAAEGILIVDKETGQVLEANAALQRSLDYTSQEARQLTIQDIVVHYREGLDSDAEGGMEWERIFSGERRYRRKDGSFAFVEANASSVSYGNREAMCVVAHDVTERKLVEDELRESLGVLLALREAGQVLGSTLEPAEVVSRLLDIMRQVSQLTATIISMRDERGDVQIWRSSGLSDLPEKTRYLPEAREARTAALGSERTVVRLADAGRNGLVGVFFPLATRTGALGVLEAYGMESLAREDTIEILGSLTSQAASALENAKLYQALGERERRLQDLVGRLISAQEEERRRVSYEVHDGLAQIAVAAHQHLQAFARRYPPETEKGLKDLERVLRLVRATVSDARRIIADLRPTTLDDFGLAATLAIAAQTLEDEGYEVEYEEDLGAVRLPDAVENALFRVIQEAINNMRKHAETRRVSITLGHEEKAAWVGVRDFGRGFDQSANLVGSGPGERVGLVGMRERLSMLGGVLEVQSAPGEGTFILATVPLEKAP